MEDLRPASFWLPTPTDTPSAPELGCVPDVHVVDGVVSFLRQKSLSEVRERLAEYYRDMLNAPDYLR